MTTLDTRGAVQEVREPWLSERTRVLLKRLGACLFGGVVLAIMIGKQEGTLTDFGVSFRHAVLAPRIVIFLIIGVLIFLAITFWPLVRPYLRRPGVVPLTAGLIVVVVAQVVMNWYDPKADNQGSSKFNAVKGVVDQSSGLLQQTTTWFFDWLAWTLFGVAVVACGATIITRLRLLGYITAVVGAAGAVFAYLAHADVVDVGEQHGFGFDHSLGPYTDMIGFVIIAGAGITAVHARTDRADPKAFLARVLEWRPGLPFAVAGTVFGLISFTVACWFSPLLKNDTFGDSRSDFSGTAISSLASQYLDWLGWLLFAAAAVTALAATYFRQRLIGWLCIAVSVAGVIFTFFTIHSMTNVAAAVAPENGVNWGNLGVGGYLACIVFVLFAAGAVQAVGAARRAGAEPAVDDPAKQLPVTRMVNGAARTARGRALVVAVLGLALFYPPMLPAHWQSTLVVAIGVYLLLALGLNVVVGWAGLLDLGYIAFYEVGAYTTAYMVGALPRKPPSWLHLRPLETIPFSILACLIAGVLLGAPTLRLRGDYLAIVTLGFGEIIQLTALNNPGNFTGGTVNAPNIPHPKIDLLGLHITWGQDLLPYWYLLLVMLVVVIVLFWRLEGSRLGRAWAAIREDEVAAQASGVNTWRVKLLAFAIGASTSALAGAFYASQVGYFDPTLFTLQASILIVAYVVFGGMGSIAGAMAGAAMLTWLPEFLKSQVPQPDRPMWVGALVLTMMIFRPAGLLPAKRRKAELSGLEAPASSEVRAVPLSEGL
jgi:ABC-type branched-subunit amino acid transport system permease subunit